MRDSHQYVRHLKHSRRNGKSGVIQFPHHYTSIHSFISSESFDDKKLSVTEKRVRFSIGRKHCHGVRRFLDAQHIMTTWNREDADVAIVEPSYMLFVACNFSSESSEYPRIQGISISTIYVVHVDRNSAPDTTTKFGACEGDR